MQKKTVTAERLRQLLLYDANTGIFVWNEYVGKRIRPGRLAGTTCRGRRQICVEGRIYRAHRLAWLYVHGSWPTDEIDHLNGDAMDNRIVNLRDATASINRQNQRRPHRRNKIGVLGVSPDRRGNFRARIDGLHLGTFKTIAEAQVAYVAAKRQLHKGNML